MTKRFAGIGGHQSPAASTVEWLTPPEIIEALGGWQSFALDPCAPIVQPYPTARKTYTVRDNGLIKSWGEPQRDRAFVNPPYTADEVGQWLGRLAEHDCGTALIFARTETTAFQRHVAQRASGLLFIAGRINFHLPDGTRAPGNAGAPVVLCAYGSHDLDVLASIAAEPEYDGASVVWERGTVPGFLSVLRLARSVLVSIFAPSNEDEKSVVTWRALLADFFEQRGAGPVELAELYAFARSSPKAATNNNVDAKVRQQLQRGRYRRVQRGLWEPAT